MKRLLRLGRLAEFVTAATPRVDPPVSEHDAAAVAMPAAERGARVAPATSDLTTPTEEASKTRIAPAPTSKAEVADDFFDGIVRRVEGDR